MGNKLGWKYFRNKLTGEHTMKLSDVYTEYPDWEMTTRAGYEAWIINHDPQDADALPVLPGSPLDTRLQAPTGTETGDGVADGPIFVGIERRIMKSGDARFLEGIDEPMGIETASYINNLSIELHNTQKVADTFAQKAADLERELAAARARVTAVEGALEASSKTLKALMNNCEYAMRPDDKQFTPIPDKQQFHELFMMAVNADEMIMKALRLPAQATAQADAGEGSK